MIAVIHLKKSGLIRVPTVCQMPFCFLPLCHYLFAKGKTHFFLYMPSSFTLAIVSCCIFFPLLTFPPHTHLSLLLSPFLLPLAFFCTFARFILSCPSIYPVAALINPIQPQEEPTLVGEEVDGTKAGGVGEEAFTEEYVTGDVGMKEYDYSYRDYNEPLTETRDVDANMGPALSAVTDEGGVSHFASEAKKQTKKKLNQFISTNSEP